MPAAARPPPPDTLPAADTGQAARAAGATAGGRCPAKPAGMVFVPTRARGAERRQPCAALSDGRAAPEQRVPAAPQPAQLPGLLF